MGSFHKSKFYKSNKWERKRSVILKRDEYLCRQCKRYGKSTPATMVHHIYPVEDYPELGLEAKNLISLCNKCHEGMLDRATGKLTALGLEWVQRVGNPESW